MNQMREAFERWALAECFDLTAVGGFYSDNETDAAYKAWQAARTVPVAQNPSRMCVVFDGPPSGEAPRFIEVEDGNGNSINAGEWLKRDDGLWELRLIAHLPLNASTTHSTPAAELATLREKAAMVDELRKDAEIGAAIQRAAKELPEGCDICINIENGAATVELYLADTDASFDMEVDADNRLAAEIHAAIDAAIEKVKGE